MKQKAKACLLELANGMVNRGWGRVGMNGQLNTSSSLCWKLTVGMCLVSNTEKCSTVELGEKPTLTSANHTEFDVPVQDASVLSLVS